ncbi:MAG: hypothetical protein ACKVQA_07955, partial [Burkholderiales bacterium]
IGPLSPAFGSNAIHLISFGGVINIRVSPDKTAEDMTTPANVAVIATRAKGALPKSAGSDKPAE